MKFIKILKNTLLFLILMNSSIILAGTEICDNLLSDFEQAEQSDDLEAMNGLIRKFSRNKGLSCSFTVADLTERANVVEEKLVAEAESQESFDLAEAKVIKQGLLEQTNEANKAAEALSKIANQAKQVAETNSELASYIVPAVCIIAVCLISGGAYAAWYVLYSSAATTAGISIANAAIVAMAGMSVAAFEKHHKGYARDVNVKSFLAGLKQVGIQVKAIVINSATVIFIGEDDSILGRVNTEHKMGHAPSLAKYAPSRWIGGLIPANVRVDPNGWQNEG